MTREELKRRAKELRQMLGLDEAYLPHIIDEQIHNAKTDGTVISVEEIPMPVGDHYRADHVNRCIDDVMEEEMARLFDKP